jgi:Arc/MetJ-type ribon-helix-helix transcriptional regulator
MSTDTMHISLPDSLKQYVKEQVAEEHYSNPSDFIRALSANTRSGGMKGAWKKWSWKGWRPSQA